MQHGPSRHAWTDVRDIQKGLVMDGCQILSSQTANRLLLEVPIVQHSGWDPGCLPCVAGRTV